MSATSGRTSSTPFAFYDPATCSVRTSQGTFPWDSTSSSVTLPRSGSMSNGRLFARPMSGLRIDASACSSLLPTPNVPTGGQRLGSAERVGNTWVRSDGSKVQLHLAELGRLLPTPRTSDSNGSGGPDLRTAVSLLPTPTASDAAGGRNSTARRSPDSTGNIGDTLTDAMWKQHGAPEWAKTNLDD